MNRDASETMRSAAASGAGSRPPIEFALRNAAGEPAVYVGDPAASVLTLTLINQTGRKLRLRGAAAPPGPNDVGEVAALHLEFDSLAGATVLGKLDIAADGWRAKFLSDNTPPLWALCPAADTTLADNDVIAIRIANIVVDKYVPHVRLRVYRANVDTPEQQFKSIAIFVKNPPGKRTAAPLTLELQDNRVRISPKGISVENELVVELANTDLVNPVKAGAKCVFYLSFIDGKAPGDGALTTADIPLPEVTVNAPPGEGWDAPPPGQSRFITLRPTGANVLGKGNRVIFTLKGIKVPFGFAAGPTSLLLTFVGLADYQDGYLTRTIEKVPAERTIKFGGSQHVNYGERAELHWHTGAIPYLQLSYETYGKGWVRLPAVGAPPLPLQCDRYVVPDPITQNTTFYLAGYETVPNENSNPLVDPSHHYVTLTYPAPRISPFTASPQALPFEFGPADVTLTWDIAYPCELKTVSLTGIEQVSVQPGKHSVVAKQVAGPKTWTLTAIGRDGIPASASAGTVNERPLQYLGRERGFTGSGEFRSESVVVRFSAVSVNFMFAGKRDNYQVHIDIKSDHGDYVFWCYIWVVRNKIMGMKRVGKRKRVVRKELIFECHPDHIRSLGFRLDDGLFACDPQPPFPLYLPLDMKLT